MHFKVEGDELKIGGPLDVLEDPNVLSLLRQRKLDLIAYLQGDESRGFRRLANGKVLWKVQRPSELKQSSALDEWT